MEKYMKQEDFLLIMDLIDGAYQNFRLTDNVLKAYYDYLKHYTNKDVWNIAHAWIEKNDNPPTIRNLVEMLKQYCTPVDEQEEANGN